MCCPRGRYFRAQLKRGMKKGFWPKLSKKEINQRVFSALDKNIDFHEENVLGIPGSHLDPKVFYNDAPFLEDAPFLSALIKNPNHIGCHTLDKSEHFFEGTHTIERELIQLCAKHILNGEGDFDGYVASGGTEANLQACWIYRNYFRTVHGVSADQITLLCSEDNHYSVFKASNILGIDVAMVKVDSDDRKLDPASVSETIAMCKSEGKTHFIVVANMMTTMFGSVDQVDIYTDELEFQECEYKLHIDGAYGGFFFPFTNSNHLLDFANPKVSSVTLDAHKMVQAPYGTGIFLVRKGYTEHANTKEASYVEGEDYTLIGSRSGANAIAIWMILMTYGRFGWEEKIMLLESRAKWFCEELDQMGISYYRHPFSNIITMRAEHVKANVPAQFGLVPDNHKAPKWFKVVVMDHVEKDQLFKLLQALA
jgi:tyrosine decarboxylase/aspartate 1-decarboxylase